MHLNSLRFYHLPQILVIETNFQASLPTHIFVWKCIQANISMIIQHYIQWLCLASPQVGGGGVAGGDGAARGENVAQCDTMERHELCG